jgi:hypothetical protein
MIAKVAASKGWTARIGPDGEIAHGRSHRPGEPT